MTDVMTYMLLAAAAIVIFIFKFFYDISKGSKNWIPSLALDAKLDYVWVDGVFKIVIQMPMSKVMFNEQRLQNIGHSGLLIQIIEDRIQKNDYSSLRNGDPGRLRDIIDFNDVKIRSQKCERIVISEDMQPLMQWSNNKYPVSVQHY